MASMPLYEIFNYLFIKLKAEEREVEYCENNIAITHKVTQESFSKSLKQWEIDNQKSDFSFKKYDHNTIKPFLEIKSLNKKHAPKKEKVKQLERLKRYFEYLCDLSPNILDHDFIDLNHFKETINSKPAPQEDIAAFQAAQHCILESHSKMLKSIVGHLNRNNSNKSSVLCIVGPAGVGKFTLIREWHTFHNNSFNVICIDCSCTTTPEQRIKDKLCQLLHIDSSSIADLEELAVKLKKIHKEIVIVYNKIQPANQEMLNRIKEVIRLFSNMYLNSISHVMLVHSNDFEYDFLQQNKSGITNIDYLSLKVDVVSDEEATDLFEIFRVNFLEKSVLIKLANVLNNYPLSIKTTASILNETLPKDSEREYFLSCLLKGNLYLNSKAKGYYHIYISHLHFFCEKIDESYAFLRLLSLTRNHVRIEVLKDVLESVTIKRLEHSNVNDLIVVTYPWVKFERTKLIINPYARTFIHNELEEIIRGKRKSKNTDKKEILAIHCAFAVGYYKRLITEKNGPAYMPSYTLAMLHGFIHHLLELNRNFTDKASRELVYSYFKEHFYSIYQSIIDAESIPHLCYQKVKDVLFDPSQTITRIHGLYEEKAKILYTFFYFNDLELPVFKKGSTELAKIITELAIGKMHLGELGIAARLIKKVVFQCMSEDDMQLYSVIACTRALIDLRRGIDYSAILKDLEPCKLKAEEVYRTYKALPTSNPAIRASVRILARYAHICFLLDDGEIYDNSKHKTYYNMANELNRYRLERDDATLEGYSGRKYIQSLLRDHKNENRVEEASAIITHVLNKLVECESDSSSAFNRSNDIYPFVVLKAVCLRLNKKYDEAKNALSELMDNPIILQEKCPYSFKIEIDMEQIRLDIAEFHEAKKEYASPRRSELLDKIDAMVKRVEKLNQKLYVNDALLLEAEITDNYKRKEEIQEKIMDDIIANTYPSFRKKDLALINANQSAIQRFGI